MAWRMIDKARSLFKLETAAKKTAAKSFEVDDLTQCGCTATETVAAAAPSAGNLHKTAKDALQAVGHVEIPVLANSSCTLVDGAAMAAAAATQAAHVTDTTHKVVLADVEAGLPAHTAEHSGAIARDSNACNVSCSKASRLWRRSSTHSEEASNTAVRQAVHERLVREQAQMLPPFQVGLLVFILADVAVASLLAGYLVSDAAIIK